MKIFKNNKQQIEIKVSKELGPITQQEHIDNSLHLLKNGVCSGVVIDKNGNKIVTFKKG